MRSHRFRSNRQLADTLSPVCLFTKHFRGVDITYNIVNVFFVDNNFTYSAFNEAGF